MESYKDNTDFQTWYKIVRKKEGLISDRPLNQDAGGLTNRGITFKTYLSEKLYKHIGKSPSEADFRRITDEEAQKIAYLGFWVPYKIDNIKDKFRKVLLMDSIFNGGGLRSLGFDTYKALNDSTLSPKDLALRRWNYYKKVPSFKYNKNGWLSRLNLLLEITGTGLTSKISDSENNIVMVCVILIFILITTMKIIN